MNHIEHGRHLYSSGNVNVKDRAISSYAVAMENKTVTHYILSTCSSSSPVSTLQKGWAFKAKREVKQFTSDQKNQAKKSMWVKLVV